jgi:predicted nucleotidyltransferase
MIFPPQLIRQVQQHPYPLLFATISGAHLYGFPSPDSDFDLRGVHVLPLNEVIGLQVSHETVEKSKIEDGLELDLVTHDAHKFFTLMLKKNGYVLEQVLSPLIVHTTPEHEELRSLAVRGFRHPSEVLWLHGRQPAVKNQQHQVRQPECPAPSRLVRA